MADPISEPGTDKNTWEEAAAAMNELVEAVAVEQAKKRRRAIYWMVFKMLATVVLAVAFVISIWAARDAAIADDFQRASYYLLLAIINLLLLNSFRD